MILVDTSMWIDHLRHGDSTLVNPLTRVNDDDYISLIDIARVRNPGEPKDVVKNWLRNRTTVEYLGLWEKINNTALKGVEFDTFKHQAGPNSFALSPNKWIETTGAISKRHRWARQWHPRMIRDQSIHIECEP